MKKTISFLLVLILLFSLNSCGEETDTYELMSEFRAAYGSEGVIYSPKMKMGEEGYIPKGFLQRAFRYSGDFPRDFALLLNSRPNYGGECGIFLCDDADMLLSMEEVCRERVRLLDRAGEHSFVKTRGMLILYSTMENSERSEKLWREILK